MFQETETPLKIYILSKEGFFYISGKRNPEKILYISGGTSKAPKNQNLLYFSKKNYK